MPRVLTICCHGTDNGSNDSNGGGGRNHVTERVYDRVFFDKLLLQGAGSGEFQRETNQLDTGENGLLGISWGKGVEHNVKLALQWLENPQYGNIPAEPLVQTLNLLGFSRGAVTCFKIANAVEKAHPGRTIVRIFAIDPVPGCCGAFNSHCYEALKMLPNVLACKVIYAEHERRKAFRPVIVHKTAWHVVAYSEDTMPGNHGGIVNVGTGEGVKALAPLIVESQALRFLEDGGVTLNPLASQRGAPDLDRYGAIMLGLGQYAAEGTGHRGWKEGGSGVTGGVVLDVLSGGHSTGDRDMQEKGGKGETLIGRLKRRLHPDFGPVNEKDKYDKVSMEQRYAHLQKGARRFFCNEDHESLFRENHGVLAGHLAQIEQNVNFTTPDQRKRLNASVRCIRTRTQNGPSAQWVDAYLASVGLPVV